MEENGELRYMIICLRQEKGFNFVNTTKAMFITAKKEALNKSAACVTNFGG